VLFGEGFLKRGETNSKEGSYSDSRENFTLR